MTRCGDRDLDALDLYWSAVATCQWLRCLAEHLFKHELKNDAVALARSASVYLDRACPEGAAA
jgi:hypothetical protein